MMVLTFSEYLKNVRSQKKLTQQALLDILVDGHESFSKLDLTTLSRWERGATSPKLEKQLIIARLLDTDITQLVDPNIDVTKAKTTSIVKFKDRTLNPYLPSDADFKLTKYTSLKAEKELCNNLVNFHNDYLGINFNEDTFNNSPLSAYVYKNKQKALVGHYLFGYMDINNAKSQLEPSNIDTLHFLDLSEVQKRNVVLNIVSNYSSLTEPRMLNMLITIRKLHRYPNIKEIYMTVQYQEVFDFFEANTNCEVVFKGSEIPTGGVKYLGKQYRYVQIRFNAENFLAARAIADFVHHVDDYIDALLS
ncbi:helix-turn-helix transcriptional regulator [Aliivibrio sp. S10_S31]|uniref:helix-turn-helix transcriptional regulator n=1 Tax=Aliivibrio sp. S10_S31 TaxID=2720224 RepID=UPI00168065C3|nr:helix-turn-helix transcriptional regulator [Aliivibrio sp. S10_S31]MBD1569735.1 helix-turn-helix transcriptional regulator [Aliivibrio sp. S10_S31]